MRQVQRRCKVLGAGLQELRHAGTEGWLHVSGEAGGEQWGRARAHVAAADEQVDGLRQRAPHEVVARRCVTRVQLVGGQAAAQQQQPAVHELRAQVEGWGRSERGLQRCARFGVEAQRACTVNVMSHE